MPRYALQVIAAACASIAMASVQANPGDMKIDRKAEEARIEANYKTSRAGCDRLSGNAKDICMAEAKGQQKVAEAELKHRLSNDNEDMRKLHMARAEAAYEVAIERCDDKAGNDKDVCRKQAQAERTAAEADAKQHKAVARANTDASKEKREAFYKAEAEKCDSLSGDAKSACVDAAKRKFGQ